MNLSTEAIAGIATAVAVALGKAVLFLLRNQQARAIAAVVVQSGAVAAHYALGAVRDGIRRAHAPDSPGGSAVTPAELQQVIRSAVAVGVDHLDGTGLLTKAVEALGGQQAVEARIVEAVEKTLKEKGYPVGAPAK